MKNLLLFLVLACPVAGQTIDTARLNVSGPSALTGTVTTGGTIELGHASDTTLARSAPAQITVEGNLVPSPASPSTGQVPVFTNSTWTAMSLGSSGIGGSTGATDNLILRADGTGGATLQSGPISISDETVYSSQYYVSEAAAGAQANNHFVISPKGTGAFILGPPPDGTATGGNNRGTYAVDLQMTHYDATSVAGGNYSLAQGYHARSSGAHSVAIGYSALASGSHSIAFGLSTTASAGYNMVFGDGSSQSGGYGLAGGYQVTASGSAASALGNATLASGDQSFATGLNAVASLKGQVAYASGMFAAAGDAQGSWLVMRNSTASTAQTTLFLDGSSARLTIPNNKTWVFSIFISGRTATGTLNSYGYKVEGVVEKGTTAGSTAIVGAIVKTVLAEDSAAADVDVTADTSNGALNVLVTAADSTATRWVATVNLTEVAYP